MLHAISTSFLSQSLFLLFQPSKWRQVRSMVQWTPFVQEFKNRKYQWVQLAGHSGNFKAGRSQGTVLKKLCPQEEKCYSQFSNDSINPFVPEYQGTFILDNDESKQSAFLKRAERPMHLKIERAKRVLFKNQNIRNVSRVSKSP